MAQGDKRNSMDDFKGYRDLMEKLIIHTISNAFYTEELIGNKDGVNKTFSTSRDFFETSFRMYLNGIRQTNTDKRDFTISGNRTVVFRTAPMTNDHIQVDYVPLDI